MSSEQPSAEVLAERARCAAIARSFDSLPFAEQRSGGLALAIAEAIEQPVLDSEPWDKSPGGSRRS